MNLDFFKILVFSLYLFSFQSNGQIINSQVFDLETKEAIPYTIISFGNNKGITTDGEGFFEVDTSIVDHIEIISLGYKSLTLKLQEPIPSEIYLSRDTIIMDEVVITNSKYSLEEILEKVEDNLQVNYISDFTEKEIFYRQKDNNKINKLNIKFKKSTIKEFTQEYVNDELNKIPKTSAFFTDVYGYLYNGNKKYKLDIQKAVKFYDTYENSHLDVFYKRLETILNKNVKEDSYFKIKSGLFSIKADGNQDFFKNGELLDMRNEMSKKEEVNDNFFLTNRRKTLSKMLENVFYNTGSPLNFIRKTNRYSFELESTMPYKNDLAYKINFFPNGGEDFKGTFYVNTEDFAILRIDYQNVKYLRSFKLLGLSFRELGRKGVMLFKKGNDDKYFLKYLERTEEDKYGIDRPLKIIEKNKHTKGRRKQNEISTDIDFVSNVVREFKVLVYDSKSSSEKQYQLQTENKKEQPKNWIKYNAGFWKENSKVFQFSSDIETLKQF